MFSFSSVSNTGDIYPVADSQGIQLRVVVQGPFPATTMVKVSAGPFDPDELDVLVPAVVLEQAAQHSASAAAAPTRGIFMNALLRDGHASAGPVVGFELVPGRPLENVGEQLDQPVVRTEL